MSVRRNPLATCILVALACSQPRESPTIGRRVAASDVDGTEWVVATLNGRPPIVGSNITLGFDSGGIGGYDGCNWYGSRYAMTDTTIHFESVEATARACGFPAGVMEQEASYHATLREVSMIRMVGNRLAMANGAGANILTLVPRARSDMNPLDLAGTAWRLRAVNDSLTADSSTTLMLTTAGELTGFAGCRAYTGTYVARGDHMSVTSITMTTTECSDRGAALREGRFTTDLSEASYYRLAVDTLEIVTAPGHRLLFAPARARREDVVGEWEKVEQTLPPIHLRLWLDRDTLRARLRLSGRELHGTATFNAADVLQVDLGQRGERLTGVLVKAGELEVRLAPGRPAYRLRKRN